MILKNIALLIHEYHFALGCHKIKLKISVNNTKVSKGTKYVHPNCIDTIIHLSLPYVFLEEKSKSVTLTRRARLVVLFKNSDQSMKTGFYTS